MLRTPTILAVVLLASAATPVAGRSDVADVARVQLDTARQIKGEATLIVAIVPQRLVPENAGEPKFTKQNWTITGPVTHCFKGRAPATLSYVITAEGRPATLAGPHIAFLRRMNGGWAAVDGPMFRDTPGFRVGLARMTSGCRK